MTKKLLHQVDLSMAKPVKVKKPRVKKVVEEEVVEEVVEEVKPYATKTLPAKVKKPPTEKQLAAREKLKNARLAKLEETRIEKERIENEIKAKEEELVKKKAEQTEKRRLKREEKKASIPLKPKVVSEVSVQPDSPESRLKLADVLPLKIGAADKKVEAVLISTEVSKPPKPPTRKPDFIRKRYYPFGTSASFNKRMR
jgi:hypothetical protein